MATSCEKSPTYNKQSSFQSLYRLIRFQKRLFFTRMAIEERFRQAILEITESLPYFILIKQYKQIYPR